jgi:hypothetical protein
MYLVLKNVILKNNFSLFKKNVILKNNFSFIQKKCNTKNKNISLVYLTIEIGWAVKYVPASMIM